MTGYVKLLRIAIQKKTVLLAETKSTVFHWPTQKFIVSEPAYQAFQVLSFEEPEH